MEDLLSFEEYTRIKHRIPYFYVIRKGQQFLYYFGAAHSFDPTHPQFKLLEKQWRNFIKKTKKRNRILLIECLIKKIDAVSSKEVIIKYGEPGLAIYLAKKDKVNFKCPEPSIKQQIKELTNYYKTEEIVYFYFIGALAQWYKLKSKPRFEKYATIILQQLKQKLNWLKFDFSLKNLKKIHQNIFNEELDQNREKTIRKAASPVEYHSVINEISRVNSMYRNRNIVREIKKIWNAGKSIFIIYGSAHALMQEKELKKLAKKGAIHLR